MLITLAIASKLLLYLGALATIGILSHFCLSIQSRLKWIWLASGLSMIGTVSKLFVANAQLAGSITEIFNQNTFRWVWQSNGTQFIVFVSGTFLALLARLVPSLRLKKAAAFIAILTISAGFAASGHTQGAENMPLLPLWVVPHILIAGFWIWAPVSLWPHKSLPDDVVIGKTERFSIFAVWAVPVLFLSGLYLLWRLNGNQWDAYFTLYGGMLLVKLAAALFLLGVGTYNKYRLAHILKTSPETGRDMLRRTLSIELGFFAIVIACILLATTLTGPGGHHR